MKIERIEELFESNSTCDTYLNFMVFDEFVEAVRQIESELKLEWYKKLDKDLYDCGSYGRIGKFYEYRDEIQNKIKELEK